MKGEFIVKKEIGLLMTLLTVGALAACSSGDTDEAQTSTSTSEQISTQTSESMTTDSTSSEMSSVSSDMDSDSEEDTATGEASAFDQLAKNFPNITLPAKVPVGEDKIVNAATDGDENDLSILYYGLDTQRAVNDTTLNNETAIAGYKTKVYDTADDAAAAVNVTADEGGQAVDLGHGITGHSQGAAGSTYLSWEEGNWSLTVRAVNQDQQDPTGQAKEVVAYLEEHMLPVPDVGQITIDMGQDDYLATTVVWQEDDRVYTVEHQEAISALEMAVSMNQ